MSWSFPPLQNVKARHASDQIAASRLPQPIRDYTISGIHALIDKYGEDVFVTVTGFGHLCDSLTSAEETSATIKIVRMVKHGEDVFVSTGHSR